MSTIAKGIIGATEIAAGLVMDAYVPGSGNWLVGMGLSTGFEAVELPKEHRCERN